MALKHGNQRGFTLPELLVFCLAVVLLLAVALKLAHPHDYSQAQRSAQRWLAVAQAMQTISKYQHSKGALPASITEEKKEIGSDNGMLNLCPELVPEFAKDLSYDPIYGEKDEEGGCQKPDAIYATGLEIAKTKDNKVIISILETETGEEISLSRSF